MENKKDLLNMNIERFDNYIEKADNKASFNLAFVAAVLIGVLLKDGEINNLFIPSAICLIISACFSAAVLIPRESKESFTSATYYKSVKKMTDVQYKHSIDSLNDDIYITELINESKELAGICEKKMKMNKIAMIFTIIALLILMASTLNINVKNINISYMVVVLVVLGVCFFSNKIK